MTGRVKRSIFRTYRSAETRLHELNYLFWECTARCNLNCLHCGSDCSRDSSYKDMPMDDFLRALDTIPEPSKNFMVVLTGGEPLLRRDLEECGKEIRRRGLKWSMVSNGQLYSPERHQSLLKAGMGALTISLDGLEASHNWLRGSSASYNRVLDAIRLAASAKRLNFDVVTCVNRKNMYELPQIRELLCELGLRSWRLFTIIPIGRAADNPDLKLNDEQMVELMDFIAASRLDGKMDVKFSCEAYVGNYELKVRDTPFFCRAGINIGSVLIDGSISACPNIDRSFVQGNIYKDDFFEVWQNRFQPFRDRSWNRVGSCADCKDYKDCLGSGFHNWHGKKDQVLICHNEKLRK